MNIKFGHLLFLLNIALIILVESKTCTLSGGLLDCNVDLCPSDSQVIIAESSAIYNCDKPLNLTAPVLQISGTFTITQELTLH